MSSKAMSLKGRIKNYAKSNNIAAQVVLQNYMFERFLERLSVSDYSEKFVVKGGMLIAAIVGLDTRSTMDLDTTLRNLPLTEEQISVALSSICKIDLNDDVSFEIKSVAPIRKDDVYGGYCVRLDAIYDTIVTPLSIDVSTGDIITPSAVKYEFGGIFDENVKITLWGYNIETVMAEKVETILSRGVFTTRPRDFYDVYGIIEINEDKIDKEILLEAFRATCERRETVFSREEITSTLNKINDNEAMAQMWEQFKKKNFFVGVLSWEEVLAGVISKIEQYIIV